MALAAGESGVESGGPFVLRSQERYVLISVASDPFERFQPGWLWGPDAWCGRTGHLDVARHSGNAVLLPLSENEQPSADGVLFSDGFRWIGEPAIYPLAPRLNDGRKT
jgi:hypothetical protein